MTSRDILELSAKLSQIEATLERQDEKLGMIERELSETRGALKLGRFLLGFLGLSGMAALIAFINGQK
jgi:hypothetical protein